MHARICDRVERICKGAKTQRTRAILDPLYKAYIGASSAERNSRTWNMYGVNSKNSLPPREKPNDEGFSKKKREREKGRRRNEKKRNELERERKRETERTYRI